MPTVEIYTTPLCPYCFRAKRLLSRKGIDFVEIDLFHGGPDMPFYVATQEFFALVRARLTPEGVVMMNVLGSYTPGHPARDGYPEMTPRVTAMTVRDGKICAVWDIANPDKFTGSPLRELKT